MTTVGLTGGFASGKSFVGHALAELGCFLIQADQLGHQVIESGGEAYDAVIREFGTNDRRALAAVVFSDPERLNQLNSIVHPAVRARTRALLDRLAQENPSRVAIVEAAILVETGSFRNYDRLILAVCRPDQQIERAMERDHITREQALERMRLQMPLEEKMKYADYVIDTSQSKEHTLAQTRAVYESLAARAGRL